MRRFLYLLTVVLIVSLVQTAEARKVALLVGVDSYVNVPKLKCCVNDMNTLKEALMKIGFEEDDIHMLVTGASEFDDLPTKKNIERKISKILINAQPSDIVFLAFSGHGAQEGKNVYFCPPDVEIVDLPGTCVSINKVMDVLANKCKAQFKWMVVDACRNDPTQGAKGIGGKGLQVIPTPPAGIALFQSCAEGEESWEDRDSGNGYFTKNFVAALSGEADSDRDGKLTLFEVCKWTTAHTKEQVKNNQNKSQRPCFSGTVSDFTLTENLNVPKARALIEEARKAIEEEKYDLAVKKYDEAIALCPQYSYIKRERNTAQRLLDAKSTNAKPAINPRNIIVPDNFSTIEEAYKNVKDGGMITIQPGKYELSKTLVVNRSVTFRGSTGRAEDVVIDCSTSHAFQITGGSSSFQNLTASSEAEKCGGFFITGGTPKLFHCVIISRNGAGMYIQGENANPQLESCTLKDCGRSGVVVEKKGQGLFIDCDISGNEKAGIGVLTSGNPTFSKCKIHDGNNSGIFVTDNGLGSFKDCEIYRNNGEGIAVSKFGNPTVTRCKIYDGKGGVFVFDNGTGTFNNNTLKNNYYEGRLCNWYINLPSSKVTGSGNTPPIPTN